MSSIRLMLAGLAAILIMAGYMTNEVDRLSGTASAYIAKVNEQPVRMLATVFFLVALVLAFIPNREDPDHETKGGGEE